MNQSASPSGMGAGLAATFAGSASDQVAAARSLARTWPLPDGRPRVLLAVAEGIGDPAAAEAQATAVLTQLEATVMRADMAGADEALRSGFAAAGEASARLCQLPGSIPGAGVALAAAVVDGDVATVANLGRGALLLRRGALVRRLTVDQRTTVATTAERRLLGTGADVQPEISPAVRLQPDDTLIACSEAVVRGLGEGVIEAVFEEYGLDAAPQGLADLAAQQTTAVGAAVALLHVPAPVVRMTPVSAGGADGVAAPAMPRRGRRGAAIAILAAGGVLGVLVVALLALVLVPKLRGSNNTNNNGARSSATARSLAAATAVTPGATPARSEGTLNTATARAAASSGVTPVLPPRSTPTEEGATPPPATPPASASELQPCGSGRLPCRYTTQPGDALGAVADRFNVSVACFEAANAQHQPVAPKPANNDQIGAAEDYIVPSDANCTALTGGATPAATTSAAAGTAQATPAASDTPAPRIMQPAASATRPSSLPSASLTPDLSGTPRTDCTPRPGARQPPPLC